MNGIILLNKPLHLSSNQALQRVKRLLGAQKAGHTGSLDPLATGLLPICLGEATKFSQYLLDADKTYRTLMNLGSSTTTGDLEGEIVESAPCDHIMREGIENILSQFLGHQSQVPPMYSALKQQGRPLYELAREGVVVERAPRDIIIHELTLLHFEKGRAELRVRCSKGTYIRTLVEDIGKALGCFAHVGLLHREAVSSFDQKSMVTMTDIEAHAKESAWLTKNILLVDAGILHLPRLDLSAEQKKFLYFGQALVLTKTMDAGLYRLYCEDQFVGMGEVCEGNLKAQRLLSFV